MRRQDKSQAPAEAERTDYVRGWLPYLPLAVVLIFGGWLASKAVPPRTPDGEMQLYEFGKLPLAYEGRIKPFDTLARNSLRVISGGEEFVDAADEKQPAIKWLLDAITYSDAANKHRVFRIENLDVLDTLGLERRKGFRYAYGEFAPRMDELRKQVELAAAAEDDQLSVFQKKIVELSKKVQLYQALTDSHVAPANLDKSFGQGELLVLMVHNSLRLAENKNMVPFSAPTQTAERPWEPFATAATRVWIKDLAKAKGKTSAAGLADDLSADLLPAFANHWILEQVASVMAQANKGLSEQELQTQAKLKLAEMPEALRTSLMTAGQKWAEGQRSSAKQRIEQAIAVAMGSEKLDGPANPAAASLAKLFATYRRGDAAAFNSELAAYQGLLSEDPPEQVSIARTNFEAMFNHFAPFYYCAVLYLVAFVLSALSWLGWNRPLSRASFWLIVFTLVVHTLALIGRMYISGRPPVTNLYSSAVFIGWGAVVFGLIFEVLYKLGIGNVIAAVAGFVTLVIAHILAADGDTLIVLQAVLDTQFWLATHVVCITLGYATTYVAGLLGVLYILRGTLTPSLSPSIGKELTRMIYGTLCFAIFFSFVGTVLGGLWADDSWGRFWGWDPKENGALIIVLWNALVLHARWGGLVKERGLAALAVGGNIVTSWSWFGVNELGIGLHSYGFTEGVLLWLGIAVASQLAVIALAQLPKDKWWSSRQVWGA